MHRNRFFLLLSLLAMLGGCSTIVQPPPTAVPDPAGPLLGVAWDDRALFRQGLTPDAQGVLDSLPGASVYQIDLRIPPDFKVLTGRESVRYTNQEAAPLEAVYYQLFPNNAGGKIVVSNVQVNGQTAAPTLAYQESALRVPLSEPLSPGASTVITMDFKVEVAREMGGNYGLFGYFDGVLVLDEFYPVIPVYDDEGWNVQDPPQNADTSYFDMSFYIVQVTAPANLTLVASGVQVDRQEARGEQVVTLAAGPMRDFYIAASADFTVVSTTRGGVQVNSYAPPGLQAGAQRALDAADQALAVFSQRFGPYPYAEFDVVSTPMLALGIEYPGMTGISLELYESSGEMGGTPLPVLLESVVAHEVGHQWFYNMVGSDQIDEPWLDESVVQYVTGLYYRDTYGPEAEASYRTSWDGRWSRVQWEEIPIGRPAWRYEPEAYSPIIYGRGPYFLAALEEEMGTDAFAAFMRDYFQTYQWRIGTGESFRQLAEEHCGCDLGELFQEWVYEP